MESRSAGRPRVGSSGATASKTGLYLLDTNVCIRIHVREFSRVPGLQVEDWEEAGT